MAEADIEAVTAEEALKLISDLGARLGRGEVIGQTPYAVKCWHATAALLADHAKQAETIAGLRREVDAALDLAKGYHEERDAAEAQRDGLRKAARPLGSL